MIMKTMIAATMIVLAITATYADEPANAILPPEIEKAVLAEDWGKVSELIGKIAPDAPVVQMLVMGHACLALNRNNDSVLLFLTASGPDDLKNWNKWAATFKQSHHDSAIAHYFVGDSLARLGQYDQAIASFSTGLNAQSNHALLLNAQGVCYARTGKLSESRTFFDAAIKASGGKIADPHANIGASWIQTKDGAEGAEASFDKAIRLSPGFAFATHGRLCSRLVRKLQDDRNDMIEMYTGIEIMDDLLTDNMVVWAEHFTKQDGEVADALAKLRESGANFKREYHTAIPELARATAKIYEAEAIANNKRIWKPIRNVLSEAALRSAFKDYKRVGEKHGFDVINDHRKDMLTSSQDQMMHHYIKYKSIPHNSTSAAVASSWADAANVSGVVAGLSGAGVTPQGQAFIAGAAATGFVATKTVDVSKGYHNFALRYLDHAKPISHQQNNLPQFKLPKSYTPTAIPAPSDYKGTFTIPGKNPGGADLSTKQMNWDEGDWPFRALYGLGYGMVPSNENQTINVKNKPEK